MSYERCPRSNEGCRFYDSEDGCLSNTHHLYWPKHRYRSAIEKAFRSLPEHKVQICMEEHVEIHATEQPPKKPSRDDMLLVLGDIAVEEAS